ncbi:hypothetical protein jhhlp_002093, partial [Lomentospora prolificans]
PTAMPFKDHTRKYDIVVFGASGYTGQRVAQHIAARFPINLKWAIAGRTESKLHDLAKECEQINRDRIQPYIEICNLNQEELDLLARTTFILITCVGPFSKYGEYAYRACVNHGTHYLDTTGEVPFVASMVRKYESAAKTSGALMLSQMAVESVPSDVVTWTLARDLKEKLAAETGKVTIVMSIDSVPSGGTLASALDFFEMFTLAQIRKAMRPYSISPVPNPTRRTRDPSTFLTPLTGLRTIPDLGRVTTSIANRTDGVIVERSWGLHQTIPSLKSRVSYGPHFSWVQYAAAPNAFRGAAMHLGLMFGGFLLALVPPIRWLAKKFVYAPGTGPSAESSKRDSIVYKGTALPDPIRDGKRAYCEAEYHGSMYNFSAVLVSEAALTILEDELDLDGGCYTPACLGQGYIDRLAQQGFTIKSKILED